MKLYRLENNGIQVDISPIGASIINFQVPDKNGHGVNIALGYDNETQYLSNGTYFGAVVGPIANRIDMGSFTLDGTTHQLTQNDGTNHLHGGKAEINNRYWEVIEHTNNRIQLSVTVNKGEGGYPCEINIQVTYILNDQNELEIRYSAVPKSRCPLNITQHVYFNLNGKGDILDHILHLDADTFLPVNENLIPEDIAPVENTPFDFSKATSIGANLNKPHSQIQIAGGFDHCWILNHKDYSMDVYSPASGIRLQAKTDLPGVQFYTGNFLNNEQGRDGDVYRRHAGLCLETQYFPNQANRDNAEECVFNKNKPFTSITIYKVSNH